MGIKKDYLQEVTSRINLGTGVYIVPLRNPFVVAKLVASLDQLSNGRFLFGIGVGWLKEEFEWIGDNWDDRARRNTEALQLMTALFTQELPAYQGKTVQTGGFYFEPKTIQQPHPPYIIGGNTEAAMKRALRLGDGWYGLSKNLSDTVALIRKLREIEKTHQRAKPLEITFGAQWHEVTADDIRRLEEAGVERVLPITQLVARDSMGALRSVHDKLLSKFQ